MVPAWPTSSLRSSQQDTGVKEKTVASLLPPCGGRLSVLSPLNVSTRFEFALEPSHKLVLVIYYGALLESAKSDASTTIIYSLSAFSTSCIALAEILCMTRD